MYRCRVKGLEGLRLYNQDLQTRHTIAYYREKFISLKLDYASVDHEDPLVRRMLLIMDSRNPNVPRFLETMYRVTQSAFVKIFHIFSLAYNLKYLKALEEIQQYKPEIERVLKSGDRWWNASWLADLQALEGALERRVVYKHKNGGEEDMQDRHEDSRKPKQSFKP